MFSDNYLYLCAKNGKHVTTVAEEIGYSRSAGTKWANGSTPRKATLKRIADYFGVTVDELLQDETKKAPVKNDERTTDYDRKLSMLVSLFNRLSPEDQNETLYELLMKAQNQLDQDSLK